MNARSHSVTDVTREESGRAATSAVPGRGRRVAGFLRHFLEMCLSMTAGMVVLGLIYDQLMAGLGYPDPIESFPVLSVVVSSVAMSAPMVGWMRYRGHSWYISIEMAAAMCAPTAILIVLFAAGEISALALNHLPHAFMCPMMLIAMLARRHEYTCHTSGSVTGPSATLEVGETA